MADGRLLVDHLREPERLGRADAPTWEALIRMARAESLAGQLSERTRDAGVREALPARVRAILDDHDINVAASQRISRWEAHLAARALLRHRDLGDAEQRGDVARCDSRLGVGRGRVHRRASAFALGDFACGLMCCHESFFGSGIGPGTRYRLVVPTFFR